MAFRTWAKLLGVTLGVAALAGAGELGVAYGLGILRPARVLDVTTRDQWTAQLAWVAWFAMTAAVVGALAGGRLRERLRRRATVVTSTALAVAAGAGAAVVVPLTMQPARVAYVPGVHPVFVMGLCAALGALVGVFAAYAALARVVARWSTTAVGLAVWAIAIASVAPSLTPGEPLPAVRLGVLDTGWFSPAVTQRAALFTMPALALLIGAAHGWTARRRGMPTLTIALAGLAGPALLTVSYLIAGPGSGADRYQVVPYWAAMTATGAGVLGSVLAAVVRRREADHDADEAPTGATPGSEAGATTRAGLGAAAAAPARTGGRIEDVPVPDQRTGPPPTPSGVGPGPSATIAGAAMATPSRHRSSAADGFTVRSGDRSVGRAEQRTASEDQPGHDPFPVRGPGGIGVPLPERATGAEPGPYDLSTVGQRSPAARPEGRHAAPESEPSGPASAIPVTPPEQVQRPPSRNGGLLARGRTPFGRGRGRPAKDAPAPAPAGAGSARRVDSPAQAFEAQRPPVRLAEPPRDHPRPHADHQDFQHPPAERHDVQHPPAEGREPQRHEPQGPEAHNREAPAQPTWPPVRNPQASEPARRTDFGDPPPAPPEWLTHQPLVPDRHAVSAPPRQWEPVTPPFSVAAPQDRRKRERRRDDDFVDWVSGLGTQDDR